MPSALRAAAHALLGVACLLGCGVQGAAAEPRNLLLVLVDTLRADHLGSYGYARDTSPHIDAFAERAVLFTEARSQAPCTAPSVMSLLTSRHALRFGTVGGELGFPSLAGILKQAAFATAAVSASPVVRNTPSNVNPRGGFGVGFDEFHEGCLWQDAACVNREALRLLESLPEPFAIYLHYMEPHAPYQPPESHPRRFAGESPGPEEIGQGNPQPFARRLYREGGRPEELGEAQRRHLIDLYDEEIAYFDGRFAELLAALERRGLAQRTLVVLLSDHGEEFLEHGDFLHCRNLYDTGIRTPLLMRIPGVAAGRRSAGPAQNLDVVPTVLDYLGVAADGLAFEGHSLRSILESGGELERPSISTWAGMRSIASGPYKLIVDTERRSTELYDIRADPGETKNVAEEHLTQVRGLYRYSREQLAGVRAVDGEDDGLSRMQEQLRALGYLE